MLSNLGPYFVPLFISDYSFVSLFEVPRPIFNLLTHFLSFVSLLILLSYFTFFHLYPLASFFSLFSHFFFSSSSFFFFSSSSSSSSSSCSYSFSSSFFFDLISSTSSTSSTSSSSSASPFFWIVHMSLPFRHTVMGRTHDCSLCIKCFSFEKFSTYYLIRSTTTSSYITQCNSVSTVYNFLLH